MVSVAFVVVAYLIGSVSFAVVVSWCFGLPDPHSYGSGNPGATNVLRTGKKAAAILTLLGHADISTTQIYTHVLEERLKSLVRDLHPLAEK